MDEIAKLAEVYPSPLLLLKDSTKRHLVRNILFGPAVPAQYRLIGENSWEGAEKTITTVIPRTLYPTRTRVANKLILLFFFFFLFKI